MIIEVVPPNTLAFLNGRFDASKEIGTLPGSYVVDELGGFNYTIPIEIPSGSNGFTPSMNINYSSNADIGILGMGWSLSGISSIVRSNKNEYFDDISEVVQLDQTDPFAIDGQRLILENGYFKTEQENFVRLSQINPNTAIGPQSWMTESKEGTKAYYGLTPNSRVLLGTVNFAWLVSKIEDLNGNYIEFKYRVEEGQNLLDEIWYTGNGNNLPYNKIKFTYVKKEYNQVKYYGGLKLKDNFLIDRIITFSNNSAVYEYTMSYSYMGESYQSGMPTLIYQREFLKEIVLKSLIDGSEYLSSSFRYYDNNQIGTAVLNPYSVLQSIDNPSVYLPGDNNNDGISDITEFRTNQNGYITSLQAWNNSQNPYQGNFQTGFTSGVAFPFTSANTKEIDINQYWDAFSKVIRSTDLDNDGDDDLLYSFEFGGNTRITRILDYNIDSDYLELDGTNPSLHRIITGDFSGDNSIDLIGIYRHQSSLGTKYLKLKDYINSYTQTIDFTSISWQNNVARDYTNINSVDIDGDGTIELLLWEYVGSTAKINYTIIDIVKSGNTYQLLDLGSQYAFPNYYKELTISDFNGDGISDFLLSNNSSFNTVILIGKGIVDYTQIATGVDINHDYNHDQFFFIDINGDRNADLLKLYKLNSNTQTGVSVYYSNGSIFSKKDYPIIDQPIGNLSNFSFGDFDGNNSIDFMFTVKKWDAPNIQWTFTPNIYYLHNGPKNYKLTAISNGMNQNIIINYLYNSEPAAFTQIYNRNTYPHPNDVISLHKQVLLTESIKSQTGYLKSNNFSPSNNITSKYSYEEAMFHKKGKGLLGFKVKSNFSPLSSQMKITYNRLEPVCTCLLPESLSTYHVGLNKQISFELNTFNTFNLPSSTRYMTQLTQNRSVNNETGTDILTSNTYGTNPHSYGEITYQIIDDGVNTVTKGISAWRIFPNNYMSGYPSRILTTMDRYGEAGDYELSNYIYYDNNGKITSKIDKQGTNKSITSSYLYDNYGNLTSTSISSAGLPTLISTRSFDDNGRFVISNTNPKGQTSYFEHHQLLGLPLTIKSIDGNEVSFSYNGFGRKLTETDIFGNSIEYQLGWVNNQFLNYISCIFRK
ncbi:MAG: hypothetical protein DWP98_12530 [Bacteroidetes bacterium]|nr:MAG: hypothetical protein DWP98_12530 [Bacteroidota bacterium]MBL1145176.1 hypothetical protein [Bacteroidota bacterium]NOG57972.1 hypothetical protein [Bacteroidota bacterium]